ncbi:hypothetical protein PR048_016425 [Dryococelus australis]|uniref:Uncharacterized protein n=1 Tax=Dryococelus australis TaxID=614101 RepID=A0ABQ9HJQ6_9NEOP|nr:hypothetical protein PR048_016425 [Dryococelus australis]
MDGVSVHMNMCKGVPPTNTEDGLARLSTYVDLPDFIKHKRWSVLAGFVKSSHPQRVDKRYAEVKENRSGSGALVPDAVVYGYLFSYYTRVKKIKSRKLHQWDNVPHRDFDSRACEGAMREDIVTVECKGGVRPAGQPVATSAKFPTCSPWREASREDYTATVPTSREMGLGGRAAGTPTLGSGGRHSRCCHKLAGFSGHREPGSFPDMVTPGFSQAGIVPDDGRRVFSGGLPFPPPLHSGAAAFSSHFTSALKTSSLRDAQISQLNSIRNLMRRKPICRLQSSRKILRDNRMTMHYSSEGGVNIGGLSGGGQANLQRNLEQTMAADALARGFYRPADHYDGNTARLARRSDETLEVSLASPLSLPRLLTLDAGFPRESIPLLNARREHFSREYGAAPEYKAGGGGETLEKTRRPEASSGTTPICENPGATAPGLEPGLPLWEVNDGTLASARIPSLHLLLRPFPSFSISDCLHFTSARITTTLELIVHTEQWGEVAASRGKRYKMQLENIYKLLSETLHFIEALHAVWRSTLKAASTSVINNAKKEKAFRKTWSLKVRAETPTMLKALGRRFHNFSVLKRKAKLLAEMNVDILLPIPQFGYRNMNVVVEMCQSQRKSLFHRHRDTSLQRVSLFARDWLAAQQRPVLAAAEWYCADVQS